VAEAGSYFKNVAQNLVYGRYLLYECLIQSNSQTCVASHGVYFDAFVLGVSSRFRVSFTKEWTSEQ
jgi:hypothetical protein